ncbi:MAG: hypothetical protein IJI41_14600 [Anaerolineaceae bacterium]|nr:hypothetical protein [Anaerolineaceae bacterium]
MKKIFSIYLLAIFLTILCVGGAYAQSEDGNGSGEIIIMDGPETSVSAEMVEDFSEPEAVSNPLIDYSLEELNVATINPLNGNFMNAVWGKMTSDIDVWYLLHGYDIVHWDGEGGMYIPDDTVVSGIVVTTDSTGNQMFTVALYPDLFYSDGTRITAWDYAFSTLLSIAPEVTEIGGNVRRPDYLVGYEEYINGDVPYLSGFRVVDDDIFSITIKGEYLPFFYAMGLLSRNPYPIKEIAPGVKVADDGRGIYLTNESGSGDPVFTAELLKKTLLDPETGYISHPKVTSGPYKLVSYEDGRCTFEINEYYKGNSAGETPLIPRLTFEALEKDQLIPALESGQIGLLNKMTSSEVVLSGIAAVSRNNAQLAFANYPRTGLALINFNTEKPIMNEVEVRKALAQLFDKDEFIAETVGNFGLRVDGFYGMGQWMYQVLSGAIAYPVEEPGPDNDMTDFEYDRLISEWEKLSLDEIPVYMYDPDAAAELLDSAGWNLNKEGNAFRRGEDAVRCKRFGDELVPLELTMAYPIGTPVEPGLFHIAEAAAKEGYVISLTAIPMEELLHQYHAVAERKYDMLFLALNFDIMFDPSSDFVEHEDAEPVWTEPQFADQELYDLTVAMRTTEPGELLEYCQKWLDYQKRIVETMPIIPLYSNVYFDFYARVLQNYNAASNVTWSQAIIPSYLGYSVEAEEELAEDEFGEDEFEDGDFIEFD